MTNKKKPISASNPPESKGVREVQEVVQPVQVENATKKLTPKSTEKKTTTKKEE